MRPVAFIDDDKQIANRHRRSAGLYRQAYPPDDRRDGRAGGSPGDLLPPLGPGAEILESLEPFPLHVRSMPGFMDLASGRVKVDDLQEVDIADLLGATASHRARSCWNGASAVRW